MNENLVISNIHKSECITNIGYKRQIILEVR